MIARIRNLRLRTIIGINDWEREHKQDIIINVRMEFDGSEAAETDDIKSTVNYKTITKRIIAEVEKSSFLLLEKLTDHILKIIMENERVTRASVTVEKPHALRFADSVAISCSAKREK